MEEADDGDPITLQDAVADAGTPEEPDGQPEPNADAPVYTDLDGQPHRADVLDYIQGLDVWYHSIFLFWLGVNDEHTVEQVVQCFKTKTSDELLHLAKAAQQFCRVCDQMRADVLVGQPVKLIDRLGGTASAIRYMSGGSCAWPMRRSSVCISRKPC